jgi:hypothetical protein
MSLLPYALRPKYLVRSFVLRRGIMHPNPLVRPIAMLIVGQGDFLRARALRHGLILGNPFWRAIGGVLVVRHLSKSVFRQPPERIGREKLRAGQFVRITVSEPNLDLSRRASRAELERLESNAQASVSASKQRS